MNDVLLMRAAWEDVQPDGFRIIIQMQLCRLLSAQRFVASPHDNGGWIPSPGPSLRGFPVSALKADNKSQCQWRREWMAVCLHMSALCSPDHLSVTLQRLKHAPRTICALM